MTDKIYPKWKFHKTKPAVIVDDKDEEKDLGSGWHDEPVKNGTTEVDPSVGAQDQDEIPATLTGDEAFDTFLTENGMDKVPARYQAMIRTAYDHSPVLSGSTIPVVEYGHPVGPQDEVVMVDSEEARQALLTQAKEMGLTPHHKSSSKTLQALIDQHTAVKSSTPAAPLATPKESDLKSDKE